jgi:hypothetical protein
MVFANGRPIKGHVRLLWILRVAVAGTVKQRLAAMDEKATGSRQANPGE